MGTMNQLIVVSGDDNSKLSVEFDQIKLKKPTSVAVHSYTHGDCKTYTINNTNDAINIQLLQYPREAISLDAIGAHGPLPAYDEDALKDTVDIFNKKVIHIPHGEYETTCSVLDTIHNEVHKFYADLTWYALQDHPAQAHFGYLIRNAASKHGEEYSDFELIKLEKSETHIRVIFQHCNVYATSNSPWKLLGLNVNNDSDLLGKEYVVPDRNLYVDNPFHIGFLSANIVQNSYLNNTLERILCVMPLFNNTQPMHYHEFKNLIYHPISVNEFTEIILEIKDTNGDSIIFDKTVKTIITLVFKSAVNIPKSKTVKPNRKKKLQNIDEDEIWNSHCMY